MCLNPGTAASLDEDGTCLDKCCRRSLLDSSSWTGFYIICLMLGTSVHLIWLSVAQQHIFRQWLALPFLSCGSCAYLYLHVILNPFALLLQFGIYMYSVYAEWYRIYEMARSNGWLWRWVGLLYSVMYLVEKFAYFNYIWCYAVTMGP